MPYSAGTIVWYRKDPSDPDITYTSSDPCAATVMVVHSPTSADLRIMVDNDTPIIRTNVPLIVPGDPGPSGGYATATR